MTSRNAFNFWSSRRMRSRCDIVSSTGGELFHGDAARCLGDGEDVGHQRCSTLKVSGGAATARSRARSSAERLKHWRNGARLIGRQGPPVPSVRGNHAAVDIASTGDDTGYLGANGE
jgi:hypothetical protein